MIDRLRPFFGFYGYTPPEYGYELFSPTHLGVLGIMGMLVFALCRLYGRLGGADRLFMAKIVAVGLVLQEIVRQSAVALFYPDRWQYYVALPLHLCSMMLLVGLVHAFFRNKYTGDILYGLGLPGFFVALLFPDWAALPLLSFFAINSYLSHSIQAAFVLMMLYAGDIRPNPKNVRYCYGFLVLVVPPIYVLNTLMGRNYLYINMGLPGSPLEILTNAFGNPGFLVPYTILVFLVVYLMFLPYAYLARQVQKNRATDSDVSPHA